MKRRILFALRGAAAITVTLLVITGDPAIAAPIPAFEYVETGLGGGLFQYDYTVSNLGDPIAGAGFDVFDVALFFPAATSLTSSALPSGWDIIAGTGFLDAFSLQPGPAPAGTDIGPGQSLAGFRFVFDSQVGALPFQAVLSNPVDPQNPVVYDGVTSAAAPAPVPEPATLLLLGTGVGSAWLSRRRRT